MAAAKRKPFDLDAAREASLAEVAAVEFTFTFGGDKFTIPTAKDWPLEAQGELARGAARDGLRLMLGDQWDAFAAKGPTMRDLSLILDAAGEASGLTDAGE